MTGAQKAQSPLAGGLGAEETSDIQIINAAEAICKRETTLIANFALRGHAVHRLADGGFLVCRHNLTRHCENLAALVRFARVAGVQ